MPKRRIRRKRKRRYHRPRTLISRKNSPLPKKLFTKLKYCDMTVINAAIASPAIQVFSANGLYDPDITGTGHQPRGFDQLMTMYDHYVVLGARIRCSFIARANEANSGGMIWVSLQPAATPLSDFKDYSESVQCNWKGYQIQSYGPTAVSDIYLKSSTKKFLGRSKVMADSQLKGDATANPVEQVYFHCGYQAQDATANPGNIALAVEIEYLVAFIEPKPPVES